MNREDFHNPSREYRGVTLWMLNDKLEKEVKRIVRKTSQDEIGKKPEVIVIVSRLV